MTNSDEQAFTFDWQRRPEGFLKWMIPVLLGDLAGSETWDRLREATSGFTEVELRIQVNDIEMPVEKFIANIERRMDWHVKAEVERLISSIPRLALLRDAMDNADHALSHRLREILREAGVDLEDKE